MNESLNNSLSILDELSFYSATSTQHNLSDGDALQLNQQKENEKVLTEILSDVQQDFRWSSVQLVKQGAETEEEQRSHAETITSQGEPQRQRRE